MDNFGFIPIEELNREYRNINEAEEQHIVGRDQQVMDNFNLQADRQDDLALRAQGQAVNDRWTKRRKDFLKSSLNLKAVKHFPEKTALTSDYGSKFSSRIKSDIKRIEKQRDTSSRLYRKKENARMIEASEKKIQEDAFSRLSLVIDMDRTFSDKEDLCDLAAFMDMEKDKSKQIASLFTNEDEMIHGRNTQEALDQMLQVILSFNLEDIRLDNDAELAKNCSKLEGLTWKIAAFDRLSEKYKYFDQLDADTQKQINNKLDSIRAISDYYIIRKDIITDPMYRSHYNDELSMDFTKAETPEQTKLAQKLLRAHIAGKNMMRKNGASAKLIKSKGEPKFQNKQTAKLYITSQEFIYQNNLEIESIRNNYIKNAPMDKADRIIRLMEERKEADRLSKQNSAVPLVSESVYKDIENSEDLPYAASEKQWEQLGGTTFKKIMAKEDADRIVKNSKGFLTAVKADGGFMEIKPSLPEEAMVKGKKVHLRKAWNLIIKSALTLLTNEDGSFKTDKKAIDISKLFADLMVMYKESDRGRAGIEEGLMQEFVPVMEQILKKNYEDKGVIKTQEEANQEAKDLCHEFMHFLDVQYENSESGLLPEGMLDDYVELIGNLNDADDELMEKYLKGYKFRETQIVKKIVDGKEVSERVIVETEATDEEIKAAVASIRKDVQIMNGKVKQVRDLDIDSKVVPIPHTCTANANFYKQLQTICTGESDFLGTQTKYNFEKNPKKLYDFMKKNLYLLNDAFDGDPERNGSVNDLKLKADTEGLTPEELQDEAIVKRLCEYATHCFSKYEQHFGVVVPGAEEDGLITIESFAAAPDQFIVDPFTMDAGIGQYKGQLDKSKRVTNTEGFEKFYTNNQMLFTDRVYLLKTYLNRGLHAVGKTFRTLVAEKLERKEREEAKS